MFSYEDVANARPYSILIMPVLTAPHGAAAPDWRGNPRMQRRLPQPLRGFAMTAVNLSFLNELFFAAGAGDGDLALTPGNADLLSAAGAIVIAVLPVLNTLQQP